MTDRAFFPLCRAYRCVVVTKKSPAALVVASHDLVRRTAVTLLELAGLRVNAQLTAEGVLEGEAPKKGPLRDGDFDIVVAADRLPRRSGLDVLGLAKAGGARTVLLVFDALGFAPGWAAEAGVDHIIPVRGRPCDWAVALTAALAPTADGTPATPPKIAAVASPETQSDLRAARFEAMSAVSLGFDGFDDMVKIGLAAPPVVRRDVFSYLAAAFAVDMVLPALERLVRTGSTSSDDLSLAVDLALGLGTPGFDLLSTVVAATDAPERLRLRALDGLTRRAPAAIVLAVARAGLNDTVVGFALAETILTVASARGAEGLDDLVVLAEASWLEPSLRSAAVVSLGRSAPAARVQGILSKWAAGDDPLLSDVALRPDRSAASARVGLATARDDGQSVRVRARALAATADEAPHDLLARTLETLLAEPEPELRAIAVEWYLRRPGLDPTPALRAAQSDVSLQRAALWGAVLAGRAGYGSLVHLVSHGEPKIRADALRLLALRFDAGRVLPWVQTMLLGDDPTLAEVAVLAALHQGRSGHALLKQAVAQAPRPETRRAALEAVVAYAASPVVDAALRRALVDVSPALQQVAMGYAVQRATRDDLSALLEQVVEARRFDLAEAAVIGLSEGGPGGFLGLARIADDAAWPIGLRRRAYDRLPIDGAHDLIPARPAEAWEAADTAPVVAAEDPSVDGWSKPTAPIASQGRRTREDPEAVTWSGSTAPSRAPARSGSDGRARVIPLARAREALQTALSQGRQGFRVLKTLADSSRVPAEVRVQAIRHLAADFVEPAVRPVLEAALASDAADIQAAALGALMARDDVQRAPVASLALRSESPAGLRMRAGRFLASRWSKDAVRADLEALLEADHSGVRRVALEGLFPSMHYTPEEQVETRLINLFENHPSLDVRGSAARALGAFGAKAAVTALGRASSWPTWRSNAELQAAVTWALHRLAPT